MNNLIKGKLGFKVQSYQPGAGIVDERTLVKIVDNNGENAGLAQYTDALHARAAAAGVRFFLGHEVVAITVPAATALNSSFTVEVRCTAPSWPLRPAPGTCVDFNATASRVLLNTPLLPTLRILRSSPTLKAHYPGGQYPAFLRVPHAWRHVKLYLHYDHAWWRSLGLTSGYFHMYGPTPDDGGAWDGQCPSLDTGALMPCSSDTLPLEGRYHDGHVRCDDGKPTGDNCRGFIEATYTSDGVHSSNVTFFEYYQVNTDPPYVIVDRNTSSDGEYLLQQAHERMVTYHHDQLIGAGLYDKVHSEPPSHAVLSMWDPKSPGFGAGTHGMNSAKIPGGKYAPGAAAGTVPAKSIKPFPTLSMYIANEAFHPADWGEGSLEMAENIVHRYFGVTAPTWIRPDTYAEIMFGGADGPPAPPTPTPPTPHGVCAGNTTKLNELTICFEAVDQVDCTALLACPNPAQHFTRVDFAGIGTPTGSCGSFAVNPACTGTTGGAAAAIGMACLGRSSCSIHPNTNALNPANPMICDGVIKHTAVQLTCGNGPVPPSPSPPPSPPQPQPAAHNCSGPFGEAVPPILRNRPSGTAVPDFFIMAAPFTPFFANGTFNAAAVLPLAKLFKHRLGITAVWVMGMRGQFDAMSVAVRKQVAAAWVAAGKATGLFTLIQCGADAIEDAVELAAHAELIGADGIGSLGPYMELCSDSECVVDWVAPVAAAAPKTPFFYYHTPGWNGKAINNVKMYEWFHFAEAKIPTAVGVKFESYSDSEFMMTCEQYGKTKILIYAPCNSLGHWNQGTPGRGAFIQAFAGPMCNRIRAAYAKGDAAGMTSAAQFLSACNNAGGNFVERYFYSGYGDPAAEFGPPLSPQPSQSAEALASINATLQKCGFYQQQWPE